MKKRVLLLVLAVLALTFVLVSCGHEHDFKQSEVITEATCDAAGKAKFVCDCGDSEERDVPAKGHTYGEAIIVAPTCWTDGYTYKVCTVCQAESEHTDPVESDAKYHVFDEVKFTTPVDCGKQQDGIKETVCSVCGAKDPKGKAEVVKATHDYEETRVEATCEAAGSVKQVCKNCGANGKETVLEQLPHTKEKTNSVPATCDKAGYDSYKCTVCSTTWNEETDIALGHSWSDDIKTKEATCTMPGYYYKECGTCHAEDQQPGQVGDGLALGHLVDIDADTTVVVEATCITPGSKTPVCKRCEELLDVELTLEGESYVEVIPATGVHFVTKTENSSKVATCHEDAYVEYLCTTDAACTELKKEHDEGTKLEHNFVHLKTIDPLCYAKGYELWVCSLCETDNTETSKCPYCVDYRNETTVPHKTTTNKTVDAEGNPIEFVPATCIKHAYTIWECGDCSQEWRYEYPESEKPLIVHDLTGATGWSETTVVIAPTCSAEGYTVYVCNLDDDCEETIHLDFTRRIEHSFTEYIDGRLVCDACSVTYRNTTTYIDEPIQSDELVIDDNTKLTWELIGYKAPTEATKLSANTAYAYDVTANTLDISGGIVKLNGADGTTYTIVVEYGDNQSKTYTVDTAKAFFDLYENDNVSKVTITASADATVEFYVYEG